MFMNFNILFKYNQIKHELLLSSTPNLSGCLGQSADLAGQWWPPWPPWGHGCRWGRKWSLKCHSWPLVCLPRRTAHLHPARDSQRNSTTFLPWCPPSRPQAQGTSPGMCTRAGPLHLQVPSRGCLGKILELEREREHPWSSEPTEGAKTPSPSQGGSGSPGPGSRQHHQEFFPPSSGFLFVSQSVSLNISIWPHFSSDSDGEEGEEGNLTEFVLCLWCCEENVV